MDQTSLAILVLIIALILHLIEEVKTGFRKRLPVGEMPWWLFIGINVVLYAFCLVTFALSVQGNPRAIPLAWAFAVGMALNGLGHIGMMAFRRAYFPGGVTAFLLVLGSVYLMACLHS